MNQRKWIKYGSIVEIQGLTLVLGNFYMDGGVIRNDEITSSGAVLTGSKHIQIPYINPSLSVNKPTKKVKQKYFTMYEDISEEARYLYLSMLADNSISGSRSVYVFRYYFWGLIIRMFIDSETTNQDRLCILNGLVKYHKLTSKYIEFFKPFIRYSIIKYKFYDNIQINPSKIGVDIRDIKLETKIEELLDNGKAITSDDAFLLLYDIYGFFLPQEYIKEAKTVFSNIISKPLQTINEKISGLDYSEYESYHYKFRHYELDIPIRPNGNIIYDIKALLLDCYKNTELYFGDYHKYREFNNGEYCAGALLFVKSNKIRVSKSVSQLLALLEKITIDEGYAFIALKDLFKEIFGFKVNIQKILNSDTVLQVFSKLNSYGYSVVCGITDSYCFLEPNSQCVIFKSTPNYHLSNRNDIFNNVISFFRIAIFVIQEDGLFYGDDKKIESFLKSLSIDHDTIKEFMGIFWWMHKEIQPLRPNLINVINKLSKDLCHTIGEYIKPLAIVNNEISYDRLDQLKTILPYLGCGCKELEKELIVVRNRYSIPNNNCARINKVTLDANKIAILETSTKVSQNILSEIFVEEDSALGKVEGKPNDKIEKLISKLLEKAIWKKQEFYEICNSENVLPGALMEKINEYTYDKCDDILLEEGDEEVYVNVDYKDLLML